MRSYAVVWGFNSFAAFRFRMCEEHEIAKDNPGVAYLSGGDGAGARLPGHNVN